jgi:hypothetical protein
MPGLSGSVSPPVAGNSTVASGSDKLCAGDDAEPASACHSVDFAAPFLLHVIKEGRI